MPKLNPPGAIESEAHVAARIAYERARRNLGVEALAKLVTDAGAPIQGSAIYRIEKGTPPRRVTVDELIALAHVFDTDPMELTRPLELVHQEKAREIARQLPSLWEAFQEAVIQAIRLYGDYARMASESSDLLEYMNNHVDAQLAQRSSPGGSGVLDDLLLQHVSWDEVLSVQQLLDQAWEAVVRLAVKSAGVSSELEATLNEVEEA